MKQAADGTGAEHAGAAASSSTRTRVMSRNRRLTPNPLLPTPQAFADRAKKAAASEAPLATSVAQFYQTDAISRASKVMAKCIKVGAGGLGWPGVAWGGAADRACREA